jgi:lipoyl(octanoyl) transferase
MLDLRSRGTDVRGFVRQLEAWIIEALALLGVAAHRSAANVGVWTADGRGREAKIAAIGVRVRRWVTFHGIALNVNPDLSHYSGIIPCGLSGDAVTSLALLGKTTAFSAVDEALLSAFPKAFPTAQLSELCSAT